MADPGVSVPADVRYELRIITSPYCFYVRGVEYKSEFDHDDIPVIARVVTMNRSLVDEKVVAVVGDADGRPGSLEFLRLISFLRGGGVVGLHRDLVT